jgi:hypothetical protein
VTKMRVNLIGCDGTHLYLVVDAYDNVELANTPSLRHKH